MTATLFPDAEPDSAPSMCSTCLRPFTAPAFGCTNKGHAADTFDGETYEPERDQARLSGLLARVHDLMHDGKWRTLDEIARVARGSEASVSARLRDLRKARFGGHTVERRREGALFHYRLEPKDS